MSHQHSTGKILHVREDAAKGPYAPWAITMKRRERASSFAVSNLVVYRSADKAMGERNKIVSLERIPSHLQNAAHLRRSVGMRCCTRRC